MAGSSRSGASAVVFVVLAVGLHQVWSRTATMVSTLQGPASAPGKVDLVETMGGGRGAAPSGGGDLVAAAGVVSEAVEPVRQLGEDAPAAVAQVVAPAAATPTPPSAGRAALEGGDCGGAARTLTDAPALPPDGAEVLEGTWGCFDGQVAGVGVPTGEVDVGAVAEHLQGAGLGGAGAAWAAPATGGVEARLDALARLDGRGLGPWVDETLGRGRVVEGVLKDLDLEAELAAWAASAGLPDFEARRVFGLASALDGPLRDRLDAAEPARAAELEARLRTQLGRSGLPPQVQAAYGDALSLGLDGADAPAVPTPTAGAGDGEQVCVD